MLTRALDLTHVQFRRLTRCQKFINVLVHVHYNTILSCFSLAVSVVGFVRSIYFVFEGFDDNITVDVQLILGGRELQKSIFVTVLSEHRATSGNSTFSFSDLTFIIHFYFFAIDSDYDPIDTILTFSPGNTTQTVTVNIQDDSLLEPTESFSLRLFPPEDPLVVVSPGVTLISISDNDRKCACTKLLSIVSIFGFCSKEPLFPWSLRDHLYEREMAMLV